MTESPTVCGPSDRLPPYHLAVRGLRKSFRGVEVLHGVDLDTRGGQVLALLGENGAGKSTTIKILAGDYARDAGTITLNGDPVEIRTPRDAEAAGVRVIFQEFLDAPHLSVAENISLGRLARRGPVVDWRAVRRDATVVLDQLGVDLPLDMRVYQLGVAQRQIVEIARALAADARLLILDEPTSALAAEEVDNLFLFIRRLRDRGVAIIYITHRLDEVEEIADDVLVFRDGAVVARGSVTDFDQPSLVQAMVGRRLEDTLDELRRHGGRQSGDDPVLEVVGARIERYVEDIDFTVAPGEIVSLFGRLGCGALELTEALFGLRRLDAGTVRIAGRPGQPASPWEAIQRGVGLVPVDRKALGLLPGLSVGENLAVADWPRQARYGLLPPRVADAAYRRWSADLRIDAPQGPRQPVETLSGGNQQKVILGRWLQRGALLLLLAEPTRGVDVGARAEIYRVLTELAATGMGILVASSDIEEVVRLSDRIVVLSRGRVSDVLARDGVDRARLTRAAMMKEAS